jgi:6-phosphogluconolactonase
MTYCVHVVATDRTRPYWWPRPFVLGGCVALLAATWSIALAELPAAKTVSEPVSSLRNEASTRDKTMKKMVVYIGTYTRGKSQGVYWFDMDVGSGALTPSGVVGGVVNPSFLAIHPNHRFLYAVSEAASTQGARIGAAAALAIAPRTGALTLLNLQPSGGGPPCHIVVDQSGRYALLASYGAGNVAAMAIAPDGRLGKTTALVQHTGSSAHPRQRQPHPHSVNLDPANRFALVPDLGLDKILVYRFDARHGTLTPNEPPWASVAPGAGPRHFAFHPNGRDAYVINEINSTITAFQYDAKHGILKTEQTVSTLPEGFQGDSTTADIHVAPSGKFLYGSNRGDDSIVVFAIDPQTGRLSYIEHESTQGKTPRNFGIDPTGTYLLAANQDTDNVVVFRIDSETGHLTPTGHSIDVPAPVCVKMLEL